MQLKLLKSWLFLCFALFAINCSKKTDTTNTGSNTAPISPTPSAPKTYQLVWSDEFNGTSIDTTNWTFEIGGNGWGNRELEYYGPNNATISNGNLVITAKKERVGSN